MNTKFCRLCGRKLFEDPYDDWRDKSVRCKPSCEELTEAMKRVRDTIFKNGVEVKRTDA